MIFELPLVSPHWPGIGRYIGKVDDVYCPKYKFGRLDKNWIMCDRHDYQIRRVYQDELNYLNNGYYTNFDGRPILVRIGTFLK